MTIDTPAYKAFKERWDLWCKCMGGKDAHSVINQICWMIWDAAAFRVINEARRLKEPSEPAKAKLNGLLHELLNKGFFTSQMAAIRRLMDKGSITGPKGVFSLCGLLIDMRDHAHLITREHLFAARGLDYDYSHLIEAKDAHRQEQLKAGVASYMVPPEFDYDLNEELHRVFDVLAGVQQRSQNDCARPDVLKHLIARLEAACDDVATHVNKFIAHAATPESRATAPTAATSLTLRHLWSAHRVICQTANLLDSHLLNGTSHHFLPSPQYDQFEYIDQPLVETDEIEHLRECWRTYDKETTSWGSYDLEDLEREMAQVAP